MTAFWWTQPPPLGRAVALIWAEETWSGTGHNTSEHVFAFADLPPLTTFANSDELKAAVPHMIQGVEYLKPPEPFAFKLKRGQGCWKGAMVDLGERGMTFSQNIYNAGDGNGSPSGGEARGTFKLVAIPLPEPEVFGPIKRTVRYRLETDAFRQGPLTDEDR